MNYRLLLIIFLIFWFAVNINWIIKHNAPPSWDEANYLEASEIIYQPLKKFDLIDTYKKSTTLLLRRAPLISEVPLPLYLIFGSSYKAALFTNLVLALIFFIFYNLLIKKILSENVALISTILISLNPLFFGLVRHFFAEFLLLTITVVYIYLLFNLNQKFNLKNSLLLGIVWGLGMMAKITFPLFIFLPTVLILYQEYQTTDFKIFLKYMFISFLSGLIIIFPWYSKNLMIALWHAKRATDPILLGSTYYYGPPFSPITLAKSFYDIFNYVISFPHSILLLILVVFFIKYYQLIKIDKIFFIWFFIPFLIFLFGPNKDYRLMLPILAPLYILMTQIFFKIKSNYHKTIILVPVIILSIISMSNLFDFLPVRFLNFDVLNKNLGKYVYPPDPTIWPLPKIVKNIGMTSVALANEQKELNVNNLRYYALKENLRSLNIGALAYLPANYKTEDLEKEMSKYSLILYKSSGKAGPDDLNKHNSQIKQILQNWNKKTVYNLPDGGFLESYSQP